MFSLSLSLSLSVYFALREHKHKLTLFSIQSLLKKPQFSQLLYHAHTRRFVTRHTIFRYSFEPIIMYRYLLLTAVYHYITHNIITHSVWRFVFSYYFAMATAIVRIQNVLLVDAYFIGPLNYTIFGLKINRDISCRCVPPFHRNAKIFFSTVYV